MMWCGVRSRCRAIVRLVLLRLEFAQVVVQTIEALLPEPAIAIEPVVDVLEGGGLDPAGPPLRRAAARDQAGPLQHLEMLGDGREAHLERRGELRDRGFAQREPRRVGSARAAKVALRRSGGMSIPAG